MSAWTSQGPHSFSGTMALHRPHLMASINFGLLVLMVAPLLSNAEPQPALCPDSSMPVQCLVDPCRFKKCTDGTQCVANYCGSCNATCQAIAEPTYTIPNGTKCPGGKKPPVCRYLPCAVVRCRSGYECVNNYCNCTSSCDPMTTTSEGQAGSTAAGPVSSPAPPKEQASPGCSMGNCPFPPCIATLCATNTRCIDDYCTCQGICEPLGLSGPPPTTPAPRPSPRPSPPQKKVCVVTASVDAAQSRVALSGSLTKPIKGSLSSARRISTLEGRVYVVFPDYTKACPTAAQLPKALLSAYVANPTSAPGLATSPATLKADITTATPGGAGKVSVEGLQISAHGSIQPKDRSSLLLRARSTSGTASSEGPGLPKAPVKLVGKEFSGSTCSLSADKGAVKMTCPQLKLSSSIAGRPGGLGVVLELTGQLVAVGDVATAGKLLLTTTLPAKSTA